jgi:hypothetical protein
MEDLWNSGSVVNGNNKWLAALESLKSKRNLPLIYADKH